jgi:hypothetical protein
VNGHYPPAHFSAFSQYMLKHFYLAPPVTAEFWRAVKANLTYVSRLGKMNVKECQFVNTLMSQLRMQSETGPNARRTLCQRKRPLPR